MDILLHLKRSSTCFLTNAVPEKDPPENAPVGIPLVQQINFGSIVQWNSIDHKSINLDLDSLYFKSSESFLKKDSPDQKSGFGFAQRNAKSVLRSKIRFWIRQKEHTPTEIEGTKNTTLKLFLTMWPPNFGRLMYVRTLSNNCSFFRNVNLEIFCSNLPTGCSL